jgi:hypothetical protein
MSTSRRVPALLAGLLLLLVPLCPPVVEGFQEKGEKGGLFIVVSITPMGQGTLDVKLKNPRTGYVHSVTLHISIPLNFKIGDLVEEHRDPRRGVVLIPVRDEGGGEDEGGDDDGHLKPVGWPSDPGETPRPPKPVSPRTEGPLKGYIIVPVGALQILNSSGVGSSPDARLSKTWVTSGKCAVLANGSFTANYVTPAVPIVRGGRLDTEGYGKSLADADKSLSSNSKITTDRRGGVAVLRDGTIVIGRQNGRSLAQIQSAFGRPGKQVWDFMGGGAMLLEGGREVSTADLFEQQGFADQDKGRVLYRKDARGNLIPRIGFEAGQLASARHTLVGVQGGQPYLIVSPNRDGRQLQRDLKAGGFSDAVKFDGGRGFYFTDGQTEIRGRGDGTGGNSLGLCVQTP